MKCLSKGCTNTSLLMTVELCYPCSRIIEQVNLTDKENGCAECGVKTSDGYALYCVKCSEPMREWVGLYTENQVQKMRESFEQSVTDPENQPSQYGTVPMKEWVGLTDEEIANAVGSTLDEVYLVDFRKVIAKLKEKNSGY